MLCFWRIDVLNAYCGAHCTQHRQVAVDVPDFQRSEVCALAWHANVAARTRLVNMAAQLDAEAGAARLRSGGRAA